MSLSLPTRLVLQHAQDNAILRSCTSRGTSDPGTHLNDHKAMALPQIDSYILSMLHDMQWHGDVKVHTALWMMTHAHARTHTATVPRSFIRRMIKA